jgi:hypothetical protein
MAKNINETSGTLLRTIAALRTLSGASWGRLAGESPREVSDYLAGRITPSKPTMARLIRAAFAEYLEDAGDRDTSPQRV